MADKYPSTILPQTNDPQEIQKGNLDLLAKINEVAASGATSSSIPWTKEASYTPTFSGFGTCTNINFSFLRIANRAHVLGTWTCGNTSASEARIGLPFGLNSDAALISSICPCGMAARGASPCAGIVVLIEPGVPYITMSSQLLNSLDKKSGANLYNNGDTGGIFFEVPISGWND